MVHSTIHGGACCGARHLSGFNEAEENDPDLITTALGGVPAGREVNVMLNLTQMRSRPRTLQKLADLGFVLTGHFVNSNHDSHVFSFSRADRRRAFDERALADLGVTWPGQTITKTLEGDLPAVPGRARRQREAVSAVYMRAMRHLSGPIGAGGRYIVVHPQQGDEGHGGYDEVVVGLVGTLLTGNSTRIGSFEWEFPEEPVPELPEMRHVDPARDGQGHHVVMTMYANVYRNGRSNRLYQSREEADAVNIRRLHIDRLDVYSNGRKEWTSED